MAAGYLDVDGARLYYEEAGSGRPLVLLHAGIADCGMWDDQFEAFAQRYRVIRYDLRGWGRTEPTDAPFAHHRDLYDLLKALGVAKTHLLAASYGGRVAIDFALVHPEMVDGLVLMAPGVGGYTMSPHLDDLEVEIEAAVEAGDLDRAAEIDVRTWFDGPKRTPDQPDPAVRGRAHAQARRIYAGIADGAPMGRSARLDPPAIEQLARLFAPTLVLVADGDQPDMLAIADLLVERAGEVTKVVLPDMGHLPNMERPAEFNQQVLDVLQRLDESAIELREITADNWEECVHLEVAEDQREMVDANAVSIAESRYHPWMLPLALYHGDEMVGFTMFATYPDPREPRFWVHRFMIDKRVQGRGFGRAGMREVVRYMAALPGCEEVWIGYDERNDAAGSLYRSLGFIEMGKAPWEGRDLAAVRRVGPAVAG
jgi:pimeloyl-ACP methyl ester carboxylesterase/RimJ/RimL family protein N-acetyltransferase